MDIVSAERFRNLERNHATLHQSHETLLARLRAVEARDKLLRALVVELYQEHLRAMQIETAETKEKFILRQMGLIELRLCEVEAGPVVARL